jgi:hypothetical protein
MIGADDFKRKMAPFFAKNFDNIYYSLPSKQSMRKRSNSGICCISQIQAQTISFIRTTDSQKN